MWFAVHPASGGTQLASPHVPVLLFVILAVAGLSVGARPVPYALGLLCLLVAILGFWAASPDGGAWIAYVVWDPGLVPEIARVFGYVFLLLFPLGWVLLAESAGSWVAGVVSYLVAGLGFVCLYALIVGHLPSYLVPLLWLFWPHFMLAMLGVFGSNPA
jgi:hypothetical protein